MQFVRPPETDASLIDTSPAPAAPPIVVPPEPEILPPSEWWDRWYDNSRNMWKTFHRDEKLEFIASHSQPNLCVYCHQTVDYLPMPIIFGIRPRYHVSCKEGRRAAQAVRETWWEKNCPVDFKDTDFQQLPNRVAADQVLLWNPGDNGMVLHGKTRRGKTRAIWSLLKRHPALDIEAWQSEKWGIECSRSIGENMSVGSQFVQRMENCGLLFLDDLDKMTMTERVGRELFLVFDTRCAQQRPTFFTTQFVGETMEKKFPNIEDGRAFVARMREFCTPIQF